MIAACKLLTNHSHTHLLRHSWQLPMYYWQKQNGSFPVGHMFPSWLWSSVTKEGGRNGVSAKAEWNELKLETQTASGSFQSTQKICLLVTLYGSCFERNNLGKPGIFKDRFWWAQEHEVESVHKPLFSLPWLTSVFLWSSSCKWV